MIAMTMMVMVTVRFKNYLDWELGIEPRVDVILGALYIYIYIYIYINSL